MTLPRVAPLALILAACAKAADAPPAPAPADASASAPTVSIVFPAAAEVTGPRVVVRLVATGVRVVPASGQRIAGEGHHHLFLDIDPGQADSLIPTGKGIYHLGSGVDSLVLDSLPDGPHRLIAVFAGGDHVPMAEVRRDTVAFDVKKP